MDILSRLFEYTFSWDLVGEWRCHGMRLGGIGEPGQSGIRQETPEDPLAVDPLFWDALV